LKFVQKKTVEPCSFVSDTDIIAKNDFVEHKFYLLSKMK
jgi:hypothetical protein